MALKANTLENIFVRYSGRLSSVLTLCFLIAILLTARASAMLRITQDGWWWNSLTSYEQATVVIAELDGYSTGYDDGFMAGFIDEEVSFGFPVPSSKEEWTKVDKKEASSEPQFSKTFGFYQAAITDFYVRYPKAMKATVAVVLPCLADKPQITCAQTAESLSR